MTLTGLIVAVITSSIVVTLRQSQSTEGRINVAAAEQSIGFSMPNDLASAATVDTDPAVTPCGTSCPANVDLSGSNALLLTWTTTESTGTDTVEVVTNVSYHYHETDAPGVYELSRIECRSVGGGAFTCETNTVLRDLTGPPGGAQFFPGSTVPTWVLQVSEPLAPDAVNETQLADASTRKDANRVVVTVNGGGTSTGAGGGVNQISITAGGTSRDEIDADSVVNAPTFTEARSRCGGPISLIIDDSGSVGGAMGTVEDGVVKFVEALAGTPTKVQVVRFDTTAGIVDPTNQWSRYFDMMNQAEVNELLAAIPPALDAGGGTNWEDGWFRTFYEPDGKYLSTLPETVVFFTDGEPTYERLRYKASPGQLIANDPPVPGPGWTTYDGGHYSNGSDYSQVAFDRADWIVDDIRSATRIIGVGVGSKFDTGSNNWVEDPGAWFHYDTYRGFRQYQETDKIYEQADYTYQRGYHRYRGTNYYSAPYDRWTNVSEWQYNSYNVHNGESDGWRKIVDDWDTISKSTYDYYNSTPDESDGFRVRNGSWNWITQDQYLAGNTTGDDSDGFRDAGKQYVTKNSDAKDWELWPTAQSGGGYKQDAHYDESHKPHTNRESGESESTTNRVILSRLVAGNDHAVEGHYNNSEGRWDNVDTAEMYVLPDFTKFVSALEAIALGECGGTVTVSTRTNGSQRTPDPVTFQNSKVFDSSATQLSVEPTVVYTNTTFPAGTFDFAIPNGEFVTVEILPHNLSDLTDYAPSGANAGWSCKVGNSSVTPALVPIVDSIFQGVRLDVRANQAVSCVLDVSR